MPHVITIKCIMCVQEKTELSNMPQRSRLSSTEMSGDLCIAKYPRDGKKLAYCRPGLAVATPSHPLATGRIARDET